MNNIDGFIESWIKKCLKLAETIGSDEVIMALTELDVRWKLPGFELAFVGEFSRGKSTLINHLLGRDILPVGAKPTTGTLVSIVAGETEKMEVLTPEKTWLTRQIDESCWDDLLASEQSKDNHDEQLTQVRLTLDNPWLKTIDIELIDSPGAGDLNSGRTALLCDLLSRCDAAVVLVSATLPLSRTEATFLEQEILGRHIPNVFVAVSKFDTVPQEEKTELLGVIRDRVIEISSEIPIIPIHPLDANASEVDALERVRTQIEVMVEKGERKIWRSRKVAGQLLDYLLCLDEFAETSVKSAQMSAIEKEQALRQLEQEKEKVGIYWEDICLSLDERRLKHTQKLKEKILYAKEELVETYLFDLKKSKDLKSWWEVDLPSQLRRELLSLGNKLSQEVFDDLSHDFEWAQSEVSQKFFRQIIRNNSDSSLNVKSDYRLNQAELTDIRHYTLLTGLGSSLATICGFIFGGPGGAAVSGVVWLLSTEFISQKTEEQRRYLSEELVVNLDRIADEYYSRTSERIKKLYSQLIEDMRQQQKVWQSAVALTVENTIDNQDTLYYSDLIEQVAALRQEIHSALSY